MNKLKTAFYASLLIALTRSRFMHRRSKYVSGTGDDVNSCSRTQPCGPFRRHTKTKAAGQINALDAGGYGAVHNQKSITIDAREHSRALMQRPLTASH